MSDKLYIPIYVRPDRYDRTKEFRNCPIRVLPDDAQPGEEFKAVPHEALPNVMEKRYYCSNFGRIWDSMRQTYLPWHFNEKYKPDGSNDGYCVTKMVCYTDEYSSASKDAYIHRMVAGTFLEHDDERPDVNHIDGNHQNNMLYNLEFVNDSENIRHAIRTGLIKSGVENEKATIDDKNIVLDIVEDLKNNIPVTEICKKYGVSTGTVFGIKTKKSYKKYTQDIDFNIRERSKPISDDKVTAICEQIKTREYTGKTYQQIADEVGVSRDVVRDIGLGRNYKHITSKYNFGK